MVAEGSTVRAVFLDLDGTLVDSLPGIEHCARRAVATHCAGRRLPSLRPLIGPPLRGILERALPGTPPALLDELVATFRACYAESGWRMTTCYPGVPEVLAALAHAGVRCQVLTNKPRHFAEQIVLLHGLRPHLRAVDGPAPGESPERSKEERLRDVLTRDGLAPADCALVGDAPEDGEAAAAAGVRFFVAAYGYGAAHEAPGIAPHGVLSSLAELLPLLGLRPLEARLDI